MSEKLKEKVRNGQVATGCFVNFFAPIIVEMLKTAGFDFIILDQEHGCFSQTEMEHMMRAADMSGIDVVVRVDYNPSSIQKVLDMGAAGVQIPMIRTKEDAILAVTGAKYPPLGSRGVDFYSRAYRLQDTKNAAEYLRKQNEDTLVIAQIETPEAAQHFEEIAGVPGIDIAFMGAMDLSVNMGYPEGTRAPEMRNVIDDLCHRAEAAHIPTGMVFLNQTAFEDAVGKGARFLATTVMNVISAGFQQVMSSELCQKRKE